MNFVIGNFKFSSPERRKMAWGIIVLLLGQLLLSLAVILITISHIKISSRDVKLDENFLNHFNVAIIMNTLMAACTSVYCLIFLRYLQ